MIPSADAKRILLTGATGYVGGRLLPALVGAGHDVRCLVRDPARADLPDRATEMLVRRPPPPGFNDAPLGFDDAVRAALTA